MVSTHNQSEAIATILCPLIRAFSPKVAIRNVMVDDSERVPFLYGVIRSVGGRKPFLMGKKEFVTTWCLFREVGFFMFACSTIELRCRYADGSARYWSGAGVAKSRGTEDYAEQNRAARAAGVAFFGYDGDGTDFQVDITNIWDQISPYLEKTDG
jgi:hypothetical protein